MNGAMKPTSLAEVSGYILVEASTALSFSSSVKAETKYRVGNIDTDEIVARLPLFRQISSNASDGHNEKVHFCIERNELNAKVVRCPTSFLRVLHRFQLANRPALQSP